MAGRQAWRPDRANVRWAKARELVGVDASVRLQDLRHFHATQLLDAKGPIPSVAKRLGRADGTTAMKVYAHGTPEGDAASADVIGNVLRGRKKQTPGDPAEEISGEAIEQPPRWIQGVVATPEQEWVCRCRGQTLDGEDR